MEHTGVRAKRHKSSDTRARPTAKASMRAWLVRASCARKEDIESFDLQKHDPFQQIRRSFFNENTIVQQFVVENKGTPAQERLLALCFDEEGSFTRQKNELMSSMCAEIWPDPRANPFAHGAFGTYVLYYTGRQSGAPCTDMHPVDTVEALLRSLRASQ